MSLDVHEGAPPDARGGPRFSWLAVPDLTTLERAVRRITKRRRGFIFRGYWASTNTDSKGNLVPTDGELGEPPALVTGLERVSCDIYKGLSRARELERALMREFRRRA